MACYEGFADGEDKVAFAEDVVQGDVTRSSFGAIAQVFEEWSGAVCQVWIVLDEPIALEIVGGVFGPGADDHVFDVAGDEELVVVGSIQIGDLGRAVDHGVPAWVGRCGFGLQVIPVLDGVAVLIAMDVEGDHGATEVIVDVNEGVIAVLKCSQDMGARGVGGELIVEGKDGGPSRGNGGVVLFVLKGAEVLEGSFFKAAVTDAFLKGGGLFPVRFVERVCHVNLSVELVSKSRSRPLVLSE